MSFDALLTQTATLRRLTGALDRYGNETPTYETEATINVRLDYQSASEAEIGAASTATAGRVYTRYTDINAHDELLISGETWRVIGDPIVRSSTSYHHLEINVERVTV
jgi:hypothetical protein